MIDTKMNYSLKELLKLYGMYNLGFKFYGNNEKGELELFLKTDINKISVFRSVDKHTKKEYLELDEDSALNIKFIFDKEVDELELDVVAIVLRTSDINIPSSRYSLPTLDKLTKQQDKEIRVNLQGLSDGIVYTIVDNNTGCTLYDDIYIFSKNNDGLINDLKNKYKKENDSLRKNNLKLIIDYYDNLICNEVYTV